LGKIAGRVVHGSVRAQLTGILALACIAPWASAWATPPDCGTLGGSYKSLDDRNLNLKIEWDEAFNSLWLDYDQDDANPARERQEFYAPDGQSHLGDIYDTGNSYVASCVPEVFTVKRDYPAPRGTVISTFTLQGGTLSWVDTLSDGSSQEMARYR
jgi:hypothetical protein